MSAGRARIPGSRAATMKKRAAEADVPSACRRYIFGLTRLTASRSSSADLSASNAAVMVSRSAHSAAATIGSAAWMHRAQSAFAPDALTIGSQRAISTLSMSFICSGVLPIIT